MRTNASVFLGDGFEAPYIAAAYYLIERFVSKTVADRYFQMEGGSMTARVGMAMTTIGETIFELRDRPALVEFCRRLRTRDPNSAFQEAMAARLFMENDFAITAISESGVKGRDFDFRAKKAGQTVCVEVTTLRAPVYSEATLKNAFAAKVKQMPKDKPGVIWCVVPSVWLAEQDAPAKLAAQAHRLFGVSKRVNAVVYLGEQYDAVSAAKGDYGMLQFRSIAVLNKHARNQCDALFFLTSESGEDQAKNPVLGELEDEVSLHRVMRNRPFFHWVDDLVGRRFDEDGAGASA
ncbi:MAG: hypothetical protein H7Z43_08540 [Clostridia bacterium]|nr:hypothetical protein [Deltaproteobacteria bacterium]